MEYAASRVVLKVYFAAYFAQDDQDPENDYDDDQLDKEDLLKEKMKWFQRMQQRINKFDTVLANGPVPLNMRHFQIMWALLLIGVLLALIKFLIETIHCFK